MRIITGEEIRAALSPAEAVEILRGAMIDVTKGRAVVPARTTMPISEGNRMGLMPGALLSPPVHGIKVLSLYPGNPARGLSSHLGFLLIFDSESGAPLAALEADTLTAFRTAAATALATGALARADPAVFTILGAGEQAEWHLRVFKEVFTPREVRIWARRPEAARALIERVAGGDGRVRPLDALAPAIAGADVVTSVTSSVEAFLPGRRLCAGQHVNLVGASLAHQREIDDEGVRRVRLFADSLDSLSREAGEYLGALRSGTISTDYEVTELGAVLAGDAAGRRRDGELTAYKSHGLIVQDLAIGWRIFERCAG